MGPGASKTLIRHAPEQERIGLADQIVLIGAHGFVVDLPDPIHFSVWACNEAVKGDPRGGNNFSHALLLLLLLFIGRSVLIKENHASPSERSGYEILER